MSELKKIKFGKCSSSGKCYPVKATVELTLPELLFLAKMVGKINDPAAEEVMKGGAKLVYTIYNCLVGDIFNRYWDGGVDDVVIDDPSE